MARARTVWRPSERTRLVGVAGSTARRESAGVPVAGEIEPSAEVTAADRGAGADVPGEGALSPLSRPRRMAATAASARALIGRERTGSRAGSGSRRGGPEGAVLRSWWR